MVVWRAGKGWQVKGRTRFGPNVVSFLLTLEARLRSFLEAYVTPNDVPDVHHV